MQVWRSLLRFAFHLFYKPFAFTYDLVSAVVSRGHWREWTRTAIPRIAGSRVLEIPCGTGNLLLDLLAEGYHPVGVDLSAAMLKISRGKLRRANTKVCDLLRARVQELPFASGAFDSIVMTFPAGFIFDPRSFAEMRRVLDDEGRLIWVDAGRLLPRDAWSRALNRAFDLVGGQARFEMIAQETLSLAGFASKIETIRDDASIVRIVTATKRSVP